MKNRKWMVAVLLVSAVCLCACGKKTETPATVEQPQTTPSTTTTEQNTQEEGSSLYEDFKNGTVKVRYQASANYADYLSLEGILNDGEYYSAEDIIEAVRANVDEHVGISDGDIIYSAIDCGSDGNEELLVQFPFGEGFQLYMVIKDMDGDLVVCYDQDAWDRKYVEISEDGLVQCGGSSGANVHGSDFGYIDADGVYHYYYGVQETITLYGDIYLMDKGEVTTVSAEGLDNDHIGLREYYFEPIYEDRTYYYNYFILDDEFNDVTTEADYDDSNELKQRIEGAGFKTYTKSEIDQMLADRAKEIGYPN
jgi:major membrane immunogen (membrane-anchored lipoprotein)